MLQTRQNHPQKNGTQQVTGHVGVYSHVCYTRLFVVSCAEKKEGRMYLTELLVPVEQVLQPDFHLSWFERKFEVSYVQVPVVVLLHLLTVQAHKCR